MLGHQMAVRLKFYPNEDFISKYHSTLADAKDEACFLALVFLKHHEDEIDIVIFIFIYYLFLIVDI